jgi:ankyrin repeat protein
MRIHLLIMLTCITMHSLTGMEKIKKKRSFLKRSTSSTDLDLRHDIEKKLKKTNKHGNNPFICAVQKNQIETVNFYLTFSCLNINHCNKVGNTALHFAAMRGHVDIINVLLQHKSLDTFIKNNDGLRAHDCLMEAIPHYATVKNKIYRHMVAHLEKYQIPEYFKIKTLIADRGINTTDDDETSPLIWAICSNQTERIIKKILTCKELSINHKDTIMGTALHYAALLGKYEIITLLLLDYRTNASVKNHVGQPPHHYIIKENIADAQNTLYETTRVALFSRSKLNLAIAEETFSTTTSKGLEASTQEYYTLNKDTVDQIIETIKKRIEAENNNQATELPEHADIPNYATDDFLTEMIRYQYIEHWLQKKL